MPSCSSRKISALRATRAKRLRGGDAAFNAEALRNVLAGMPGAYRDTVLMNAGAGLVVAGKAAHLGEGILQAAAAIDSGRAAGVLDKLVKVSNG